MPILCRLLVIVHDLDVVRVPVSPHETETPLVVDTDAVLPLPLAAQSFQNGCRAALPNRATR